MKECTQIPADTHTHTHTHTHKVDKYMLEEATYWFSAAQPQNNHTETVLIKSPLGPLALASYCLTLTLNLTPLH